FIDEQSVRDRLVDFSNESLTRVRFHVPAIHCIACVWLLENLHRLEDGVGHCQVNFSRKEVAIAFQTGRFRLSDVIALLASLGYEPELRLADLDNRTRPASTRTLWMQLGI